MPKLVLTAATLSTICVAIMAEAAFFNDYNSIGEGYQTMRFDADHNRYHQAPNYDLFGEDDQSIMKSQILSKGLGRDRGRRRGGAHGNGISKSNRDSKTNSSKKKEVTTTTEYNVIDFMEEKKKMDDESGKTYVTRLNENLAHMFGGTNGLEFDLCKTCGELTVKKKTKPGRKKAKETQCEDCDYSAT